MTSSSNWAVQHFGLALILCSVFIEKEQLSGEMAAHTNTHTADRTKPPRTGGSSDTISDEHGISSKASKSLNEIGRKSSVSSSKQRMALSQLGGSSKTNSPLAKATDAFDSKNSPQQRSNSIKV